MTTTDNVYEKLANVTRQLGRERTTNDSLRAEVERLRDDLEALTLRHRDAKQDLIDLRERLKQKESPLYGRN